MKIAIQGELGSFSHEAAQAILPSATVIPCARSLDVFDQLEHGAAQGAVIAVENSLAGSVAEHLDLLLTRDVHIVCEFRLRIVHNLIALPGTNMGNVRRVFSHPVALDQCRDLFTKTPRLKAEPFYDTAGSVKHVMAEGLTDAAGIASRRAAEVYGARILKKGIEDDKKNFTRFFLIHRGKARAARGADKTSLAFILKSLPGALFKALSVFALRDIDLSKLESRPLRGRPWEYFFYVDFAGNVKADHCKKALGHLGEVTNFLRVLGCYESAKK